jgi:hypothetical protein
MTPVTQQQALEALSAMDDFARMCVGVDAHGPRGVLERFIAAAPAAPALPNPGSPEVSAMIDSVLAEYNWPANTKNAARAGYVAATRLMAAPAAPAPLTDEQIDEVQRNWIASGNLDGSRGFARAIEQAHGIGAASKVGGKP